MSPPAQAFRQVQVFLPARLRPPAQLFRPAQSSLPARLFPQALTVLSPVPQAVNNVTGTVRFTPCAAALKAAGAGKTSKVVFRHLPVVRNLRPTA